MRGRRPVGPEAVQRLNGSAQAKQRLQVVLETLAGTRRVQEACDILGIGEVRFNQLRLAVLEAGLAALEPRPAGRPPQTPAEAEQPLQELTQRVETLEGELQAARLREEIAVILPQAASASTATADETQKKTAGSRKKKRRGQRSQQ